jgi:hypothetical protein
MNHTGGKVKRQDRIQFRVSEIEKEMALRLAQARGLPLADLLRRLISLEVDKYQIMADSAKGN